ncbi:hypothetical protein AAE478_005182 [Parahypoxylon ruwenzoriense]
MPWEVLHAGGSLCFLPGMWEQTFPIADEKTRKNIIRLDDSRTDTRKGSSPFLAWLRMFDMRAELHPDYVFAEFDVIKKICLRFIKQGHGSDLLYQTRLKWGPNPELDIPSWLPQLTASEYPKTISTWCGGMFAAAEYCESIATKGLALRDASVVELDNKVLYIQGYGTDEVIGLGQKTSNTSNHVDYLK